MRLFLLFFIFGFSVTAQDYSIEKLHVLEDEELLSLFNKVSDDSIKAERVARVYLRRARSQNDTIKMARGYDRLARIFHPEKNLVFADSIIELTKDIDNITYPALGYLIKAYTYNQMGDLQLELQNSLKCYELAEKRNNISQLAYITDYLIYSKSIWGNKEEALELQKERHSLLFSDDYIDYIKQSTRDGVINNLEQIYLENELSSIQNFVFCFMNLKKLDSANLYLNKGFKKIIDYKGYSNTRGYYIDWFKEASIEVNYHSKKYNEAIETANDLLLIEKLDDRSIVNILLYKGLSYLRIHKEEFGIKYLNEVDSIIDVTNNLSINPSQRVLYEALLNHYDSKNDMLKKIEYLNKLLFVDSIFNKNYQYFEPDLIKKFETPKLLRAKEELISNLEEDNIRSRKNIYVGLGVLLISLITLGYYFNRQLVYKKRFESLIATQNANTDKLKEKKSLSSEISKSVLESILAGLETFEKEKKFLSSSISLRSLAVLCDTNPRYLSKVVNSDKNKNFSKYINDLRVEYAFKELTENPTFRKYTIKAIASDCGFKGAESFSKRFYERYKVYPSYFIKKLES